jgi:hypothetical protein
MSVSGPISARHRADLALDPVAVLRLLLRRPLIAPGVSASGLLRTYQSFGRDYQAGCPAAPHFTGMGQKTANIDIRVEPQLVEKIDAWCGGQRVPPSRTAAIVYMIAQFLKHDPRNWEEEARRDALAEELRQRDWALIEEARRYGIG